ncbi:MAG: SprT-like domain-containing protein [Bdellovibrionota bacterium]
MNFCFKEKEDNILKVVWNKLNRQYFPDYDLYDYKVVWSNRRQKRTLASCNVKKRIVRVAGELNYNEHYKWLAPLLHHEMCHAVMAEGAIDSNGKFKRKIRWHGKDFKKLERSHPLYNDFQFWIKSGGWQRAIRSARTKEWWKKVKNVFKI